MRDHVTEVGRRERQVGVDGNAATEAVDAEVEAAPVLAGDQLELEVLTGRQPHQLARRTRKSSVID